MLTAQSIATPGAALCGDFLRACAEAGQQLAKGERIHRLDQMRDKSCVLRAPAIRVLTPAAQGHQHRAAPIWLLFANPSSRFVPIETWQADIEQDHVGVQFGRRVDGFHAVVGDVRVVPAELEDHRKHLGRVPVVVDHQHAQRRRGHNWIRSRRGGHDRGRLGQDRQSHDELTALPGARAAHLDGSAVHVRQGPHQGQADAEARGRLLQVGIQLREHVEDV